MNRDLTSTTAPPSHSLSGIPRGCLAGLRVDCTAAALQASLAAFCRAIGHFDMPQPRHVPGVTSALEGRLAALLCLGTGTPTFWPHFGCALSIGIGSVDACAQLEP